MRTGHKVPDCDGRWIDVSTFEGKRSLCPKCRATVKATPEGMDELDERASTRAAPEDAIRGEDSPDEPMIDFLPLAWIFIAAVALAGFVGFLFGRYSAV